MWKRSIWFTALLVLGMAWNASAAQSLGVDKVYEKARALESCDSAKKNCFAEAINVFKEYQSIRTEAFLALQPGSRKSDKVALLVHSYTMSPTEMWGLSHLYFEAGYNVLAVQLAAHGYSRDFIPMQEVSEDYWKADVEFGLNVARQLGAKTVLTGYSLGGLLSVHATLQHPEKVQALALFAPALWLRIPMARLACTGKRLINTDFVSKTVARQILNREAGDYEKKFVSGGCQIRALISEIDQSEPYIRDSLTEMTEDWYGHLSRIYSKIKVPVLVVGTDADEIVDSGMVKLFAGSVSRRPFVGFFPESQRVSHVNILEVRASQSLLSKFIEKL